MAETPGTPSDGRAGSPRDGRFVNARELVIVAVLLLGATLLLQRSSEYVIGAFNDDGVYVALGKAIAEGRGYHSIYMPGDPVQVKYPPGLPTLFALLWLIGGSLGAVAVLVHSLNLLVLTATGVLVWWYGRVVLGAGRLPLAVFALGPLFLECSLNYLGLAISEPYYLLGWITALLLFQRVQEARADAAGVRRAALLGGVLALAVLFRSQAIALVPAMLLALLAVRARARALVAFTAAAALPLLAWRVLHGIWQAAGPLSNVPDEVRYSAWLDLGQAGALQEFVRRVLWHNVVSYSRIFGYYLTEHATTIGVALVALVVLLGIAGAWLVRARAAALPLTVAASIAIALAWPWAQDRLVLVSLPFLGLLAAVAVSRLSSAGGRAVRVALTVLLLVGAAAAGGRQYALRHAALDMMAGGKSVVQPFLPTYYLTMNGRYVEDVSRWVRANARPTDRILVEMPSGVYLHTGRKAVSSRPPQSRILTSSFANPGEYLARRILEEDVTLLAVGNPRFGIAADVRKVMAECPRVARFLAAKAGTGIPAFFALQHDDACLRERVLPRP